MNHPQEGSRRTGLLSRREFHGWRRQAFFAAILTILIPAAVCNAQPAAEGPDQVLFQKTVDRGIAYLASQQGQDGSLSGQLGIGPTALATLALLKNGRGPDDPQVAKGLAYLQGFQQPSGEICNKGSRVANYETCVALMCFHEANRDGRYDKLIEAAETFVRGGQWDAEKGKEKDDFYYGGVGYGGQSRPDLSNTAFLIDTLKECGAGADDEAIRKALVFVSRCQNLESEHNTTPPAGKINDGGFYYTCVLGRQETERQTPEGGLRSYGAMTYSGLKSMIYAGLTPDDPRVKAAVTWIREHYDLDSNPGMGNAGLYYYYHTFAKALQAMGEDEITDAHGKTHNWRHDLIARLAELQREDGSWVNANGQWMENDPNLVTAYALLALSCCRPEESK